jgi:hypothetical protein
MTHFGGQKIIYEPFVAELPAKVTLLKVGLLLWFLIPPPPLDAELPEKVMLVRVGLLLDLLDIPPP